MSEQTIINEPVEFILAGKPIKVRRLGVLKRKAILESWFIGREARLIRQKSEAFSNPLDKRSYVIDMLAKIPQGQELIDAVNKMPMSFEAGIELIKEAMVDFMPDQDLEKLILESSEGEFSELLDYVFRGSKKKSF